MRAVSINPSKPPNPFLDSGHWQSFYVGEVRRLLRGKSTTVEDSTENSRVEEAIVKVI